jgi:hypothetical protein
MVANNLFWLLIVGLVGLNVAGWWLSHRRPPTVYS